MLSSKHTGYTFDRFEVQLQKGVLLHNNFRVRIQRLPFQMLLILLERPGELVSREDICAALWKSETSVELENSLYVAAAKLREALGDDPATPRYVKTIARQGYQFVADVISVAAAMPALEPNPQLPAEQPDAQIETGIGHETAPETHLLPFPTGTRDAEIWFRWRVSAIRLVAVGLAATVLSCGLLYKFLNRPLTSANDKLVLGEVRNSTGDPSLDEVFSSALRLKLQESPSLSLVEDAKFRRQSLLDNSSRSSLASSLTDGLKACNQFGAQLFVAGEIVDRPNGYRVEIDAWRCRDGRLLAVQAADASSQSEILQAVETAALSMRRRLGEPDNSLQKFNVSLIQATTSSLAALKSFTRGETDHLRGNDLDATTNYKLAVDLDPNFAMAYARLGSIYTNAEDGTLGRQYFQKAFELRDRATDREKLYIAAHYYSDVLGDMPRGIDAYQLWESLYPRDVIPVENLGSIYDRLGEPDKALALEKKAVQMRPDGTIRYALLASAELKVGLYTELNNICNDPIHGQTDEVILHYDCYLLAFEKNDASSMERQLIWGRGKKQESVLLEYAAWAEMSRGKLVQARHTFDEARQSAVRNNMIDFSAELDLDEAWLDADLGFVKEANALTTEALKLAPARHDLEASAALVSARLGGKDSADQAIAHVMAKVPLNTVLVTGVLTAARAAEEMHNHNPKGAIQIMERSRSMDNVSTLALAPAYYRGLAYLDDHRYDDAAREFQSVIDHRALMPESLYVELSLMQLGHALQLGGQHEDALKQYHMLERIWVQADADFPALQQLRAFEKQTER